MIVKTLLDTDLYKFTTSYAYIKLFPYAMGTFSFNDRNETKYTEAFLETLKAEIKNLSQLRFTEEELEYMTKNCRFLPRVYVREAKDTLALPICRLMMTQLH